MTNPTDAGTPTVSHGAAEKRVSWAELFFDLVFVVAVTRVSATLVHDHDADGMVEALVVFVPIYWLWVGTAIQTNQQDANRPGLRLRVFLVALAAVFMGLALDQAYDRLGLLFALSYWAGRVVLGLPLMLAGLRGQAALVTPFSVSMLLTGPLLVVGALSEEHLRLAIWGVAGLVDLLSPTLLRSRLRRMRYDPAHLAERFGLFVLIALGETVVAVGLTPDPQTLDLPQGLSVAVAFAVCVGLWWVYFQFAADAVRHAMATAAVQLDITRLVLSYGHLAFISAIILVAVGLHDAVVHPTEPTGWSATALMYGGCALYLATFGFTRWAMFHLVSWTRLTAAAVILLLLPLANAIDALAALVMLAAVLAVLNSIEYLRVESTGWRALLDRRGTSTG
jgi:low temperature requirement protein LtrA